MPKRIVLIHPRSGVAGYSFWLCATIVQPYLNALVETDITPYHSSYTIYNRPNVVKIVVDDFFSFHIHRVYYGKDYVVWCDSACYDFPQRTHKSIMKQRTIMKNAWFIPVLESEKRKIEECGWGDRVLGVVPRAFNVIALNMAERELKEKAECCGSIEKKYDFIAIGFMGGLDRKRFIMIHRIARRHPEWRFCVITNYPEFDKLPNVDRYSFGSISEVEKFKLILQSKYLIYPSMSEGFGMPVLEAMASGVPVIYNDAPSHNEFAIGLKVDYEKEYIETHSPVCTFKFRAPNEKKFEETMAYALENYDSREYRQLSNKARYEAYKKFKPCIVARQLYDILKKRGWL